MTKTDIIKNLYETFAYLQEYDPEYPLLEDMGELLKKVNSAQFENSLRAIAVLEKQAAQNGMIENAGYFDALLEAWNVADLEGLGSWLSRQRDKFKDKTKSLAKKVAKYNPATFSARRALATLLSMNIYGYATKLKKDSKAYAAFMKKWKSMGGDEKYMASLLTKAATKKPLLVKNVNGIYTDELGAFNYTIYVKQAKPVFEYIDRITEIKHVKSPAVITKNIQKIYNPSLAAFESLLKMNYKNYASLLLSRKDLYDAVEEYYKKMNGDLARLKNAIAVGYRHSPIGNLGVVADIKALLDLAKPILDWMSGLFKLTDTVISNKKSQTQKKAPESQSKQNSSSKTTNKPEDAAPIPQQPHDIKKETKVSSSNGKMKKLIGVGVAFLTGVGIYVVMKNKNDNKILSGIKFK